MNVTKLKIGLTSAVALSCAGLTYILLQRLKAKKASEAFDYLTIEIITSEEECDQVIAKLRENVDHHAIGFDCEWVTEQGKRQPVALLQLSTSDGLCVLFRLSHMKSIPKSLQNLLEDDSIYKVGVAPLDDAKYLAQDYGIHIKATLDIRHLVSLNGYDGGGLAALSLSLLGVVLDKTWRIRCSNWAAEELSDKQIHYAASDAHVAIKIFVKLINNYHKGGFGSWFHTRNEVSPWKKLYICKRYADISYKNKDVKKTNNNSKYR